MRRRSDRGRLAPTERRDRIGQRRRLLGAPDRRQIEHAIAVARVIVTADHDFLVIADDHVQQGVRFPGVLFILPQTTVGEAVRAISLVAAAREPSDVASRIEWIR